MYGDKWPTTRKRKEHTVGLEHGELVATQSFAIDMLRNKFVFQPVLEVQIQVYRLNCNDSVSPMAVLLRIPWLKRPINLKDQLEGIDTSKTNAHKQAPIQLSNDSEVPPRPNISSTHWRPD